MIVVDANVIAYLYLPGDHTTKAERLLERDADWAAPLLWRSEFRNILAGCMRRKMISHTAALDIQSEAESLMAGAEHEVDSRQVLGWCGIAIVPRMTVNTSPRRKCSAWSSSPWTPSCGKPFPIVRFRSRETGLLQKWTAVSFSPSTTMPP